MIRLVLASPADKGRTVPLTEAERHYLFRVMRRRVGDRIEAVVPGSGVFSARLVEDGIELGSPLAGAKPGVDIQLGQALLKQDRFAEVVDRGTQVGISSFVPVVTERTVVRDVPAKRLERWRAVAREAAEQSRRSDVPEILPPIPLLELTPGENAVGLVLDPKGEALHRFLTRLTEPVFGVVLAVGPEGGFSPREADGLAKRGFVRVSLGPYILRAENAGMVAAALIRFALFPLLAENVRS